MKTTYQADTLGCFVGETTFVTATCPECFVTYAIPKKVHAWALESNRRSLCCPFGHGWHYSGRSLASQLQRAEERAARERALADQVRADRDALQRSLSATRGVVTRTKRRVANGVCPCCNRTFVQLGRHMAAQHPDYVESAS